MPVGEPLVLNAVDFNLLPDDQSVLAYPAMKIPWIIVDYLLEGSRRLGVRMNRREVAPLNKAFDLRVIFDNRSEAPFYLFDTIGMRKPKLGKEHGLAVFFLNSFDSCNVSLPSSL